MNFVQKQISKAIRKTENQEEEEKHLEESSLEGKFKFMLYLTFGDNYTIDNI